MKIPSGWKQEPLELAATLQRGFDLPVQSRRAGSVPVVASNGPVGTHDEAPVKGPGVVTGRSGTIGKVYYYEHDFWPLNTTLYVKDFHGNEPKFIAALLEHLRLERFAESTGVPSLNRNTVHPVPVLIPPLSEQREIAAILSSVDDTLEKTQAVIDQLEVVTKGLLGELLTRGMPGRHKAFKTTPLGDIPASWDAQPFGALCSKIVDGVHKKPDYQPDGIPFITVKNLTAGNGISFDKVNYVSQSDHDQFIKRANPELGDVLLSKDGTLGVPRVIETAQPFSIFVSVALLKPFRNKIDSWFMRYALEAPAVASHFGLVKAGLAIKHIHLVDLRQTPCPVPPIEEQREIVSTIRACEARLTAEREWIAALRRTKTALLDGLLSGRVRALNITQEAA